MDQIFTIGDCITSQSGIHLLIINFIGEGGQGQVYEVESGGKKWALKYYSKEIYATHEQLSNLRNLIEIGSPDSSFLWPIDIVQKPKDHFFGYIMPLRPPQYASLIQYVKRRINPTFYSLITAALNLTDSFSKLHTLGLCYRDISLGNIFINPDTGDVLICDNDNVCYNNSGGNEKIGGTAGFMAPEIVMGRGRPNRNTDLYSLSVLLFHLLFISHPLHGVKESQIECWDVDAEKKLHGSEALFIFDPNNDENRPDPLVHQNALIFWNTYPDVIRQLFVRAFTDGLFDIMNGRVRENEWKIALIQLRDLIFTCTHCESQVFYDPRIIVSSPVSMNTCWQCEKALSLPPRITIGNGRITMLNAYTTLYAYHLNPTSLDAVTSVARVSKHPNMNIYGLQNLTHRTWVVSSPDGKNAEVSPHKNVPIIDGLVIDFGAVKGKIQAG